MTRYWLTRVGIPSLAVATVLLVGSPEHGFAHGGHGGGGHGGGHHGGGFGGYHHGGFGGYGHGGFGGYGHGGFYRGGYGYHGGFGYSGFNRGYGYRGFYGGYPYRRFYGGYGFPFYSGLFLGLGLGGYGWGYPSYGYYGGYPYSYNYPTTYPSYYPSYPYDPYYQSPYIQNPYLGVSTSPNATPSPGTLPAVGPDAADRAMVSIQVPANAEVWFGSTKMTQAGRSRQFESPPLAPGKLYVYNIRATWMQDGKPVSGTKQLYVEAGKQYQLAFSGPEAEPKPIDHVARRSR